MKKPLLILTVLFSLCSHAQKTAVGIMNFTYVSGSAEFQTVNSIQETVTNAFVKTKRFNIVDRAKMDALKGEKELQKTEDFMDGTVVSQSSSLGADYLISGHVISANAERMMTSEGAVTYKAKMSINLKAIDVATGQVVASETITPKAGSLIGGAMGTAPTTPEKAISKALKDIEKDIDKFVSINFPLTVSIAEIAEEKKGAASVLLIAVGSGFGVQKNDKFKVVVVSEMEVDGKKLVRKKEIGEIKIINVEDENFSKCQVKDGGKLILSKFSSGEKLKCISTN